MIRRPLAALAAAALLAPPLAAQRSADYPTMPKAGPPRPFTVPASETYRLPNGMQVTLIPYGQVPKATISLRVYAGSLNEGDKVGLASFVGQMLREGAAGRKNAEIAAAAASMGGGLGVGAGTHETSIGLNVLSEHAADAVRLIADVGRRPEFPASEVERVRQTYLRSLAVARSQPQTIADVVLANAYYGNAHPYGRVMPTDEQVKSYTVDDLRRFHQENFGPRRARLYVAGRFDSAAVKAAIAEAFGDWAPGPERLRLPPSPAAGPRVLLVDRPGAPQSTIRIAYPAPVAGTPADIPFRVTNALLGGSFTSRITHNIREVKGYTYSPGSFIQQNAGESVWAFDADVTTAVTGPALHEVLGEIRRLQTEPVPDEEATGIRTWLAGTFVLQNASPGGLIGSLSNRDFHGLPADWLTSYVPGILAVSGADMQRLAREQLPLDKATLVVVGDLATVEPQLKALPELQGVPFQRVTPFR
ncbi:MAG: insulinase family protein [Alphaproteobacteria bacterium]|nr:insulinase family protein [Alphaproteobacteria bacterium]